jgi:hypothetical protein
LAPYSYDRYGLTSNPFRELSSESLEDIEIFHVNLNVDDQLRSIREEVLAKDNRAVVAVVGGYGAGKTERMRVAEAEGREAGAFTVFLDVTATAPWVLRNIALGLLQAATDAKLAKTFSQPKWIPKIQKLAKIKDDKYDPIQAGRDIAEALTSTAPSFLLLNDLHNLTEAVEIDAFGKTLQEIFDAIRPGVMVMFGCYTNYLVWLIKNRPALASRINRAITLPKLSTEEAALLLAKKMLAKRLVEDLDPIFPFDREAVAELNSAASGNPRRLLEMADLAIEYGIEHRSYRVDVEVVRSVLLDKEMASIPNPEARPQKRPPEILPPEGEVDAQAPVIRAGDPRN